EFAAGHRLRVQLTSNDAPNHAAGHLRIDRDDPSGNEIEPHLPSINTVRYGGSEGTSILLPVLP
ncbi:MAG: hypothetical protein ACREQ9_13280, partial [Candidatus Binatia bacterium]